MFLAILSGYILVVMVMTWYCIFSESKKLEIDWNHLVSKKEILKTFVFNFLFAIPVGIIFIVFMAWWSLDVMVYRVGKIFKGE